MSNKRIDLDKYASMPIGGIFGVTFDQLFSDVERHEDGGVTTQPLNLSLTQMEAIKDLPKLITELKRMYERENELLNTLRIIRDDLGDILPSNDSQELMLDKIYNFANEASE